MDIEYGYLDHTDISFEIDDIKLFVSTFSIYIIIFMTSYINYDFSVYITPSNFIKGHLYSHELVSYCMSTIHSIITGTYGLAYFLNLISLDNLYSGYHFSLGYFSADIVYFILISESLKDLKKNMWVIFHNIILILMLVGSFIENSYDEEKRAFYLAMGLIAEYSFIPLNICWYIKNTNKYYYFDQEFIMYTKILIVTYFVTCVINLSYILHCLYLENMFIDIIISTPITLLNYWWFYKLIHMILKKK